MHQDPHISPSISVASLPKEVVSPSLSAQLLSPQSQSSHMSVDPVPFQLNEQAALVTSPPEV